jgi:hypothetical protein
MTGLQFGQVQINQGTIVTPITLMTLAHINTTGHLVSK